MDLLMQGFNGNSTAISQLASTLSCDINAVQTAINAVQTGINQVGSTGGLTVQQVINAIQSGNQSLSAQLAQCCCDNKLLITTQGYENRIANTEQTAILGGKIDNQTTLINDKFCQLEMRAMQDKIDSLREEKTNLKGIIDNANQTATIQNYINGIVTPLASDVASIKCKLPQTVNVPYSPVTTIPNCVAYNMGLYGFPYSANPGGSIWS